MAGKNPEIPDATPPPAVSILEAFAELAKGILGGGGRGVGAGGRRFGAGDGTGRAGSRSARGTVARPPRRSCCSGKRK